MGNDADRDVFYAGGILVMMEVKQDIACLNGTEILAALLDEMSAITEYRALRDTLPRRLARLLRCRCVLLYQRVGETLQLAAGSYDDRPGWSPALLAVARINPIALHSDVLEAQAWRARRAVSAPAGHAEPHSLAVPLLYRQRATGVLVAIRESTSIETQPSVLNSAVLQHKHMLPGSWSSEETQVVEVVAGMAAMQLENTRLLERDHDRIHELSLLNSISRQFHSALSDHERLRSIVVQRTREITVADRCDCLLLAAPPDAAAWLPQAMRDRLGRYFSEAGELSSELFMLERTGNDGSGEYFEHLPASVKTFFAVPLWRSRKGEQAQERGSLAYQTADSSAGYGIRHQSSKPALLGMIVGAYHHPWKLRREEVVMLSVLANQASSVLENMALVADVVEARNEARKLLHKVLDDQRFKEFILESIPGGLVTVDLHGQMTTVNRAAQDMLGYRSYEMIGQPAHKLFPARIVQHVIYTGVAQREILSVAGEHGQERTLDATFLPLRDDREKVIGALITFSDVTSMRRLEEEKRRLDRLASLGEMAASVAHEVRNPLASIKTSMQMLLDDLAGDDAGMGCKSGAGPVDDDMLDSARVVLKEVERLDSIVRDLLLFSRPRSLHPVECYVVEICERVLSLMAARCAEAGVVVHRAYLDAPPVLIDVAQLEQVLLNLCINAVQAMREGGILTICCQVRQMPAADALTRVGNWLEITVSDTGPGIAMDHIDHIFQPFYTTKAHGIGLGLPISRRLVEDHHGILSVESRPGFGATFSILLPLSEEPLHEQGHVDRQGELS
ncbi:MAG TPA: ATP-binding protein [Ktedonobacteraceae bacterium]